MQEFLIFSLAEANLALGEVIRVTEATLEQLNAVQDPWSKLPFRKFDAYQGAAVEDLIRAEWARCIGAMGIEPKGFFVVDFQSPDPDTLYCWAYNEATVANEHKTWETFADRRPVGSSPRLDRHSLEERPPASSD